MASDFPRGKRFGDLLTWRCVRLGNSVGLVTGSTYRTVIESRRGGRLSSMIFPGENLELARKVSRMRRTMTLREVSAELDGLSVYRISNYDRIITRSRPSWLAWV